MYRMTTVAAASPYTAGGAYQGIALQDVRPAFGVEVMVAYGLLHNSNLKDGHRDRLRHQLLRYCELASLPKVLAWAGLSVLPVLTQPAYGA